LTKPFIQLPAESILTKYPQPIEFADKQLEVFWLPGEINVDKDIQSVRVDMTEAEKHGVLTTLRLFTLYELRAGGDYWGNQFTRIFPRPEFRRMASVFSMFELAVHAPFYNKLNEALNVSTDEFYLSYTQDPILKERMEFIDSAINGDDELYSIAVFSLIEGAVLYSAFAFLKHFQANGKNKLNNVCRGINFSVRDEALHAQAGAWCFRELLKEKGGQVDFYKIYRAAETIRQHEYHVIDMTFAKGEITGISAQSLKDFVDNRLSLCMSNLGLPLDPGTVSPIEKWFYKDINDFKFNDFFSGIGSEYRRDWDEKRFTW
jgi:ribonucleoside-diphosphate reductase beta chain